MLLHDCPQMSVVTFSLFDRFPGLPYGLAHGFLWLLTVSYCFFMAYLQFGVPVNSRGYPMAFQWLSMDAGDSGELSLLKRFGT